MTFLENPIPHEAPESVAASLPESIRERRNLVNLMEWIRLRHPARLSLNAKVRRRLDINAA